MMFLRFPLFHNRLTGDNNRKLYIDKPISNIRYRKFDIRPARKKKHEAGYVPALKSPVSVTRYVVE